MIIVITECFSDINIISCLLLFYYIVEMKARISIDGWTQCMIPFILVFFNDRSSERTFVYLVKFVSLSNVKLTFHSSHLNSRRYALSSVAVE